MLGYNHTTVRIVVREFLALPLQLDLASLHLSADTARMATGLTFFLFLLALAGGEGGISVDTLANSVADRCLFDPWIRDPGWVKYKDPNPG
jgi:hypothetical protein